MKNLVNTVIHWVVKLFTRTVSYTEQEMLSSKQRALEVQKEISQWVGTEQREKIGLGQNCNASWYLKATDNKRASYPFDWIYTTPEFISDMLKDDFGKLMDKDLIIPHGMDAGHQTYHEMLFGHRNPVRSDADYNYYQRSIARWRTLMKAQTPIVFMTVVLNEFEKRKRWREGFTKEFKMPADQQLSDFRPMMNALLAINPNCKFLYIEQYTEQAFELRVEHKEEAACWIKFCAIDKNTGVQYLNPLDHEVMTTILTGLHT